MKAWMALLWAGLGFGFGYFVGDRVRQKMDADGVCAEQAAKEVTPEQLGYSVPDTEDESTIDEPDFDKDIQEMTEYLAETEHPEEDDDNEAVFVPKVHAEKHIMVVTVDEMMEDLENYTQVSLHWYGGDDVLCNDMDEPLPLEERDQILGSIVLDDVADEYFFGDGAELAIRNDILKTYYDVFCMRYKYSDVNGEHEEEEE